MTHGAKINSKALSKVKVVLATMILLLFSGCSSNRELIDFKGSRGYELEKYSIINNGVIGDTNIITAWLYHSYVLGVDGIPLPRFSEEEKDFLGLTTEANLDYSVKVSSGDHELIVAVDFERHYTFLRKVQKYIGICRVNLQDGHEYVVKSKGGREIEQVVIDLASNIVVAYCNEMIKATSEYNHQALMDFLSTRKVGP